jgi:hypothetical protein
MMDTDTIRALADEQAERAAREGHTPYVPWDEVEVAEYGFIRPVPFPNIGSYSPPGWELVEHELVDKTGMGEDWEPALTLSQLKAWINEGMGHSYGYAIIEEGEFQVVIGRFSKVTRGWAAPVEAAR